jgi:hypothetical protein
MTKAVAPPPPIWLLAPREGELFDSPDEVYARLQVYALGAGFAAVQRAEYRACKERTIGVPIMVHRLGTTASCLSRQRRILARHLSQSGLLPGPRDYSHQQHGMPLNNPTVISFIPKA